MSAIAVLITLCGCASDRDNPGVFGDTGGAAADRIARGSNLSTGESLATGAAPGAMISATVFVIAKHKATPHQRKVAVQRARAVVAKRTAVRHAPRYLAVDTVKDDRTSPKARKAVIIWDTQSEQIVGNDVYDVQTPPPVGSTARFETYSAEYVGSGS